MPANAYVLLNVEPARTHQVLEVLRGLQGTLVREVLGPFDIVVELEAPTMEALTSILRSKIRTVPGVTSTVTCTWMG